jgi:hypothetical protein
MLRSRAGLALRRAAGAAWIAPLRSPASSRAASSASAAAPASKRVNLFTAVNDAMSVALETDPTAIVFGEDVGFGGVFRCSTGLRERFGADRVFNTPLNECAIAGFGIGYAAMGRAWSARRATARRRARVRAFARSVERAARRPALTARPAPHTRPLLRRHGDRRDSVCRLHFPRV